MKTPVHSSTIPACIKMIMLLSAFFSLTNRDSLAQDLIKDGNPEEWAATKSTDGIFTYVRWIMAPSGEKYRQRKVEMVVESSLSAIVATIKDDSRAKQWMNRVEQYYNFNIRSAYRWSNYTRFGIPWPLKDQDLVTDNYMVQDPRSGSIHIEIRNDTSMIPEKNNVDRIPDFRGSWDIIPFDTGKVKIIYTLFSGRKPWLPQWIIDPIVESGLCSTFDDMREVIADKNAGEINLDYIADRGRNH